MAGVMVNDDFMRFVNSKYHDDYQFGEVTERDIREYIRKFKDTTVTDFVFNVNAQMSYSPSRVWMTAAEKYETKEEMGHSVNYTNSYYKVWYDIFVLQKLDMYSIWIEELNKIGVHPWISFRMNDTHDNHKEYGGIRRSPYFRDGRRNGKVITSHREKTGYFDDCLDYKHEDVRNYHLAYIEEQLSQYDVYGVEMDYMREPFLCSPGEEGELRIILTEFFGKVKHIIKKAEQKYGHPIKFSIRCFRDIQNCYDAGLDIFVLVRNGTFDLVIPTPRWRTCDSDIPLYLWRKIFPEIELAAGLDNLYVSSQRKDIALNHETVAALSMQYLSNGADYIYLFNYTYLEDFTVYKYLGNIDELIKKERRHIVSFQDVGYLYSTLYLPLPLKLQSPYSYLRIQTGRIDEKSKVVLRLGADKRLKNVYVNSKKCEFLGETKIESQYFDGKIQEFLISRFNQDEQIVEVNCSEGAILNYAEIHILCLSNENFKCKEEEK